MNNQPATDSVLRINQCMGQGFFSCCTVHLQNIIDYVNQHRAWPSAVDSTGQFIYYKTPETQHLDIKHEYFDPHAHLCPFSHNVASSPDSVVSTFPNASNASIIRTTDSEQEEQYSDYRQLNYGDVAPFVQRYFSPSPAILRLMTAFTDKYQLCPEQTCVLFYRGNDKSTEIALPDYQQYIEAGRRRLTTHPDIRFWIQSDETQFLDAMKAAFPNHVVFYDEIRHMSRNPLNTVDRAFRDQNAVMSKNFVAITYLMASCKFVVCGTGNCSYWIALFRGNADGIVQLGYHPPPFAVRSESKPVAKPPQTGLRIRMPMQF